MGGGSTRGLSGCARQVAPDLTRESEWRALPRRLQHLFADAVVTVARIDRLARLTFDLFAIVKSIVDAGRLSSSWRSGFLRVEESLA
jgi:hypothetical protein